MLQYDMSSFYIIVFITSDCYAAHLPNNTM